MQVVEFVRQVGRCRQLRVNRRVRAHDDPSASTTRARRIPSLEPYLTTHIDMMVVSLGLGSERRPLDQGNRRLTTQPWDVVGPKAHVARPSRVLVSLRGRRPRVEEAHAKHADLRHTRLVELFCLWREHCLSSRPLSPSRPPPDQEADPVPTKKDSTTASPVPTPASSRRAQARHHQDATRQLNISMLTVPLHEPVSSGQFIHGSPRTR